MPLQLLFLLTTQVISVLTLVILTTPLSVLSSHRMAYLLSDGWFGVSGTITSDGLRVIEY